MMVATSMLITGQHDKMVTDLRNSTGSRELSAVGMESLVSGVNHIVSNLVFSLCTLKCLAKVRDTAMLQFHCSPSSHFLLRQPSPVGLPSHCLMQHSGSQYLHKSCSLSHLVL